jgi:hypothetical protein
LSHGVKNIINLLLGDKFDHDKGQDCQEGHANIEEVIVEHSLLLGPSKLIHGERRAQRFKDSKYKQDNEEEKYTNDGAKTIVRLPSGCGHTGANTGVHIGGSKRGRRTAKRTWNVKLRK